MAYQIKDLNNNIIETLETRELVEELFTKVEQGETSFQLFWNDEGLVEQLKSQAISVEDYDSFRIIVDLDSVDPFPIEETEPA
jgi:hypothetical protein